MTELVVADIGGTHARFALARLEGGEARLGDELVLETSAHGGPVAAWRAFEARIGRTLPPRWAIAIAAPIEGDTIRMVNNHWAFRWSEVLAELKLEALTRLNDFEAIAFAVPACGPQLRHVCGPDRALPETGIISVMGPGTGLGVAILDRRTSTPRVIGTEGSHIAFAPLDALEDRVRQVLAAQFGRVSVERVVSGPGLRAICTALGREVVETDRPLWQAALSGTDPVATEALACFSRCLGAALGDLALAHGSQAVVIAGGLGLRLADHLPRSGFEQRFIDKGRYRARMESLPVKLLTHPQPGLLGAALAYAAEHGG